MGGKDTSQPAALVWNGGQEGPHGHAARSALELSYGGRAIKRDPDREVVDWYLEVERPGGALKSELSEWFQLSRNWACTFRQCILVNLCSVA